MDIKLENLAQQLNKDVEYLLADKNKKIGISFSLPKFYQGEEIAQIGKVSSTIAPCGKIAVVYLKQTFDKIGAELTKQIKNANCIPLNFIMPESEEEQEFFSVENFAELFYFPEDVRAVVTVDNSIISQVCYYASVINIPVIYSINNINSQTILPYGVFVKNKGNVEYVKLCCEQHIILDHLALGLDKNNFIDLYAEIVSKTPAFIDYRIKRFLCGGKNDSIAYEYARHAVSQTFSAIKFENKNKFAIISYNLLKIQLANFFAEGRLFDFSAVEMALKLIKKKQSAISLNLCQKILQIYALCFSGKYEATMLFPDYLKRAESLSFATGEKSATFIKSFKYQKNIISKWAKKIEEVKKILLEETESLAKAIEIARQTYIAFGGKEISCDLEELNTSIKYAGDLPNTFNGITLARESGITELI